MSDIDYSLIQGMDKFTVNFENSPETHQASIFANKYNQVAVAVTLRAMDSSGAPLALLSKVDMGALIHMTSLHYLKSDSVLGDELTYDESEGYEGNPLTYSKKKHDYCITIGGTSVSVEGDPARALQSRAEDDGTVVVMFYVAASQVLGTDYQIAAQFTLPDGRSFDTSGANGHPASTLLLKAVEAVNYSEKSNWLAPTKVDWVDVVNDVDVVWGDGIINHHDHNGKSRYARLCFFSKPYQDHPELKLVKFSVTGSYVADPVCDQGATYGQPNAVIGWGGETYDINFFWVEPGVEGFPDHYGIGLQPDTSYEMHATWHYYFFVIGENDERHSLDKSQLSVQTEDGISIYLWNLHYSLNGLEKNWNDTIYNPTVQVFDQYGNHGSVTINIPDADWLPTII